MVFNAGDKSLKGEDDLSAIALKTGTGARGEMDRSETIRVRSGIQQC